MYNLIIFIYVRMGPVTRLGFFRVRCQPNTTPPTLNMFPNTRLVSELSNDWQAEKRVSSNVEA